MNTKVTCNKKLHVEAKLRNLKLKKNALEFVDIIKESISDPKFKTELCKSWVDTGFCIYGNKCRFAHGKSEIFEKPVFHSKYKQKNCLSFFQYGFCNYGTRCHFKHNERVLGDIEIPYFKHKLLTTNYIIAMNNQNQKKTGNDKKRLSIFKEITRGNAKETFNSLKAKENFEIEAKSLSSESQIKKHNESPINTRDLRSFY